MSRRRTAVIVSVGCWLGWVSVLAGDAFGGEPGEGAANARAGDPRAQRKAPGGLKGALNDLVALQEHLDDGYRALMLEPAKRAVKRIEAARSRRVRKAQVLRWVGNAIWAEVPLTQALANVRDRGDRVADVARAHWDVSAAEPDLNVLPGFQRRLFARLFWGAGTALEWVANEWAEVLLRSSFEGKLVLPYGEEINASLTLNFWTGDLATLANPEVNQPHFNLVAGGSVLGFFAALTRIGKFFRGTRMGSLVEVPVPWAPVVSFMVAGSPDPDSRAPGGKELGAFLGVYGWLQTGAGEVFARYDEQGRQVAPGRGPYLYLLAAPLGGQLFSPAFRFLRHAWPIVVEGHRMTVRSMDKIGRRVNQLANVLWPPAQGGVVLDSADVVSEAEVLRATIESRLLGDSRPFYVDRWGRTLVAVRYGGTRYVVALDPRGTKFVFRLDLEDALRFVAAIVHQPDGRVMAMGPAFRRAKTAHAKFTIAELIDGLFQGIPREPQEGLARILNRVHEANATYDHALRQVDGVGVRTLASGRLQVFADPESAAHGSSAEDAFTRWVRLSKLNQELGPGDALAALSPEEVHSYADGLTSRLQQLLVEDGNDVVEDSYGRTMMYIAPTKDRAARLAVVDPAAGLMAAYTPPEGQLLFPLRARPRWSKTLVSVEGGVVEQHGVSGAQRLPAEVAFKHFLNEQLPAQQEREGCLPRSVRRGDVLLRSGSGWPETICRVSQRWDGRLCVRKSKGPLYRHRFDTGALWGRQ